MVKRNVFTAIAAATLSIFTAVSLPARADDTEIYLNPNADIDTQPLVMFSLDYRPNLTSPAKANVESFFNAAGMSADVAELKAISGGLTYFDTLILSLKFVLSEIDGVKIGLMMSHADGQSTGYLGETPSPANKRDSGGGTILYGFNTVDNPQTIIDFKKKLIALKKLKPNSNSPDHTYQGAELFFDFFRYLTGGKIFNSHNGWADFEQGGSIDTANNMRCSAADATINPACWDRTIENPPNPPANTAANNPPSYISPLNGIDACTKIYTINFLFQVSQQDNDSNNAIAAAKNAGGMGFNPGNSKAFDNVLQFLNNADLGDGTYGTAGALAGKQNVTSYFLVDPTKINTTTNGYAKAGGTGTALPLAEDPAELIDALRNIFQQILSTSTTFVAASVPVNVFNRAEAVDNVYLALFQAELGPGWPGTVKKLRFKTANYADGSSDTILVDSLNNFDSPTDTVSAFGADGRIRFDAHTFWSSNAGNLMQLGDANSDGVIDTRDGGNNAVNPPDVTTDRDGRHITRGGAGQQIPGFISGSPGLLNTETGARQLFYDSSASALAPLNADNTTSTALVPALGVPDAATALPLIQWMRGIDVDDKDGDGVSTDPRYWFMGDPLHSRPLPINYGTDPNDYVSKRRPGIFIAVASNDGYLRFIENTLPGTSTPATGNAEPAGVQSGKEVWAFMPKAAMPHQKLLRAYDGSQTVIPDGINPNVLQSPDPTQTVDSSHIYTLDGAPSSLVIDELNDGVISGNDKVYLYFGMRRGGRNIYGMNVTNPRSPQLMWVIEGGTGDFTELGRTFSQPKTGKVRVGNTIKNAVFFSGGYSYNKDRKVLGTADTVGNAIFVVDAETGALIWKATGPNPEASAASASNFKHASLVDSIPSNLTVVDTDGDTDRVLDRILVGDTGGKVWRADISAGNGTADWKLTLLANLGRHAGTNDKPNDRRFMNEPDFVQETDSSGAYDAVILGSGDREDPLDRATGGVTQNWFYLIKDRNIGVGAGANSTLVHANLTDVTDVCVQEGKTVPCNAGSLALGWKMQLEDGVGEKNLAPALTFDGTVFFTSYLPPGSSEEGTCGPAEGNGLLYAVRMDDATPAFNYNLADGDNAGGPNTQNDRSDPLKSGGIPAQVVFLPPGDILRPDGTVEDPGSTPSFRTFWRRRED